MDRYKRSFLGLMEMNKKGEWVKNEDALNFIINKLDEEAAWYKKVYTSPLQLHWVRDGYRIRLATLLALLMGSTFLNIYQYLS